MNFNGNDLISFSVDGKALQGITNNGRISANGGQVLVTANVAAGILDNVINMDGIVEARSVGVKNGTIIISGDTNAGVVEVGGQLNAGGVKGGNVTITGYNILLDPTAKIDVSGDLGGGTVLIGGNAEVDHCHRRMR